MVSGQNCSGMAQGKVSLGFRCLWKCQSGFQQGLRCDRSGFHWPEEYLELTSVSGCGQSGFRDRPMSG